MTKTLRHADAAAAEANVCKTRTPANENIWLNAQDSSIVRATKSDKRPNRERDREREGGREREIESRENYTNTAENTVVFRRVNKLTT